MDNFGFNRAKANQWWRDPSVRNPLLLGWKLWERPKLHGAVTPRTFRALEGRGCWNNIISLLGRNREERKKQESREKELEAECCFRYRGRSRNAFERQDPVIRSFLSRVCFVPSAVNDVMVGDGRYRSHCSPRT